MNPTAQLGLDGESSYGICELDTRVQLDIRGFNGINRSDTSDKNSSHRRTSTLSRHPHWMRKRAGADRW